MERGLVSEEGSSDIATIESAGLSSGSGEASKIPQRISAIFFLNSL